MDRREGRRERSWRQRRWRARPLHLPSGGLSGRIPGDEVSEPAPDALGTEAASEKSHPRFWIVLYAALALAGSALIIIQVLLFSGSTHF